MAEPLFTALPRCGDKTMASVGVLPATLVGLMPFHSLQRWISSVSPWVTSRSGRPRSAGWRVGGQALAEARLDFADALIDLRQSAVVGTLDRIAVARSLHDLWNYREEIFALVAHRHDQREANERLATLDRHFAARPQRTRLAERANG